MNLKNSRKKLPIHENADANITCDFGAVLGVSYLTHVPQARTKPHSHVDFLNLIVDKDDVTFSTEYSRDMLR